MGSPGIPSAAPEPRMVEVRADDTICIPFIGPYARFSRRRKKQMKKELLLGYVDNVGAVHTLKGALWFTLTLRGVTAPR